MRVAPLHDMGGCGQRGAEGVVFGESHDALLSWIAVLHITGNPKRRRVAVRGWRRDPVLWGMMCFHSLNFGLRGQHEAAADWARKAIHEPRSAHHHQLLAIAPFEAVDYWPELTDIFD